MISIDSVVALNNTFVTADKLDIPQLLKGIERLSKLTEVINKESSGYIVRTDSFDITVSPQTRFLTKRNGVTPVEELQINDRVATATGLESVISVVEFNIEIPMVSLVFDKFFETFSSQGFFLVSD